MENKLHIVCLDAPAPPNYGGAIDMYYKVKALAESGRHIELHYFSYKEGRDARGLEAFCTAIHSYPRKSFLSSVWQKQPFITGSRNNPELLERLLSDNVPVLLEGIHCAGLVPYIYGKRKLVLRMHNDEAAYYAGLAGTERSITRRMYFNLESRMLQRFQLSLPKDLPLACVAHHDMTQLQREYGFTKLKFVPSFTASQTVQGLDGRGSYCLYQGNMEVSENELAAFWLLENIFSKLDYPLIISGRRISDSLQKKAARMRHVQLLSDPTDAEMDKLVREAQVHVLPSFNSTGLKLKMLRVLFDGRHVLSNKAGVAGTEFGSAVQVAETPGEFQAQLQKIWEEPFGEAHRQARTQLAEIYSNKRNAALLNAWL